MFVWAISRPVVLTQGLLGHVYFLYGQVPSPHNMSRRSAQVMLFPMRPVYERTGTQKASSQESRGVNASQQCMPVDGAGRCNEAPGSEGTACCSVGVMGSSAATGIAAAGCCRPVRSSTPASATPGGSTQTHMQVGAVLWKKGRRSSHVAAYMPCGLKPVTVWCHTLCRGRMPRCDS